MNQPMLFEVSKPVPRRSPRVMAHVVDSHYSELWFECKRCGYDFDGQAALWKIYPWQLTRMALQRSFIACTKVRIER